MNGIPLTKAELIPLNKKVHLEMQKSFKGYHADLWADINTVKRKGELYFFPTKEGERAEIINRLISKKVVKIDRSWYPDNAGTDR